MLTFAELGPVEGATARLVRGDDVLFTRTDTRGLGHRHVVTLSGPRLPGQVAERRSTFAGGCEAFLAARATHDLAPGECNDLQFAVFPATD